MINSRALLHSVADMDSESLILACFGGHGVGVVCNLMFYDILIASSLAEIPPSLTLCSDSV